MILYLHLYYICRFFLRHICELWSIKCESFTIKYTATLLIIRLCDKLLSILICILFVLLSSSSSFSFFFFWLNSIRSKFYYYFFLYCRLLPFCMSLSLYFVFYEIIVVWGSFSYILSYKGIFVINNFYRTLQAKKKKKKKNPTK